MYPCLCKCQGEHLHQLNVCVQSCLFTCINYNQMYYLVETKILVSNVYTLQGKF